MGSLKGALQMLLSAPGGVEDEDAAVFVAEKDARTVGRKSPRRDGQAGLVEDLERGAA